MARVTIINMDRDTRKLVNMIIGAVLLVIGIVVIFDYLMAFFRLLLGLILIIAGFYYLTADRSLFGRLFFRF
jgi:uncharacterized membrane protein HdeD (DUF308 family)